MDGPGNNKEQQGAKLAAEMEELAWENYWYQMEINHQYQSQVHLNNGLGHEDEDKKSQFFGPIPAPAFVQRGWPWYDDPAPMAVSQWPGGRIQQQAAQQQVAQEQVAHQPAVHQPIMQQQISQQQPSAHPPRSAATATAARAGRKGPRMDHKYDHLAEKHGYDRTHREYTVEPTHLKRKTVGTLQGLLIRDARKLAWSKARLLASEEAIRQADPSYVSRHGLGLSMDGYSIPAAMGQAKKKNPPREMLIAVRDEMGQKGRLHSQAGGGQAQSSWGEVYDDLVSTFHLARIAVDRRAEQYFRQLRIAMGDDMAQIVTPAQVELTHQLQLKPGASLLPK